MISVSVNGELQHIDAHCSVADMLIRLGYNCAKVAVAVNGEFVARASFPERRLQAEDQVDVVAPVQGG